MFLRFQMSIVKSKKDLNSSNLLTIIQTKCYFLELCWNKKSNLEINNLLIRTSFYNILFSVTILLFFHFHKCCRCLLCLLVEGGGGHLKRWPKQIQVFQTSQLMFNFTFTEESSWVKSIFLSRVSSSSSVMLRSSNRRGASDFWTWISALESFRLSVFMLWQRSWSLMRMTVWSAVCHWAHVALSALLEFNQSVLVSRKDPESRKKAVAQLIQRLTSDGYWPQVRCPPTPPQTHTNTWRGPNSERRYSNRCHLLMFPHFVFRCWCFLKEPQPMGAPSSNSNQVCLWSPPSCNSERTMLEWAAWQGQHFNLLCNLKCWE